MQATVALGPKTITQALVGKLVKSAPEGSSSLDLESRILNLGSCAINRSCPNNGQRRHMTDELFAQPNETRFVWRISQDAFEKFVNRVH